MGYKAMDDKPTEIVRVSDMPMRGNSRYIKMLDRAVDMHSLDCIKLEYSSAREMHNAKCSMLAAIKRRRYPLKISQRFDCLYILKSENPQ